VKAIARKLEHAKEGFGRLACAEHAGVTLSRVDLRACHRAQRPLDVAGRILVC
jgi:hypothetical protein